MNEIIKNIEAAQLKESVTEFHVGDTVKVHARIKEGNRERVQVFEGTVLKRQGGSSRETFTVRKNSNGVGVEKTWPVHSPNVEKIEVVRRGKVRRAKLFYLRDRVGKKAKEGLEYISNNGYPYLMTTPWHYKKDTRTERQRLQSMGITLNETGDVIRNVGDASGKVWDLYDALDFISSHPYETRLENGKIL